ncbi:hypothetical protein EXIGLDRAFT_719022 [Exidia glandulosa HHB12029]|uniref:MYND-type domain-containing protein n=1 Tax=Exidia glandulosa HHB12029 TaxID=1314781 RepID=A0A165NVJ3_EXIGL|nr:hypothetical protein EXIGLDRAFT_719022 [Exidia glandulosa HHB12029]
MAAHRARVPKHFEHVVAPSPFASSIPDNFLPYIQLKFGAFYTYDQQPDFTNGQTLLAKELIEHPTTSVKASADRGVAQDCLLLAGRLAVGCGVRQDVKGAYRYLLPLVMDLPTRPSHVPRPVEARAHSVLANLELEDATRDPDEWNIDALFRAASFANNAAALGFVSPVVLDIARRTTEIGARSRATWRYSDSYPWKPEFAKLEYLWGAMDARLAEIEREDRKQGHKISKNPTSYMCATPGCGITVTKKAALLRCSGGCGGEQKAHYCSKECQEEDWKRHKATCKPGKATTTTTTSDDPQTSSPQQASTQGPFWGEDADGKERSVMITVPDMPDGTFKVSSKTIGAAALKDLRAAIEKPPYMPQE